MQQVMRRGHTHTGEAGSMDEFEFDPAFAAMYEDSGGCDKAESKDHMGDEDCAAGKCGSMNGSDSTCSMYVYMQVCMFACMHECMYI